MSTLQIVVIHPELLGTYGDIGNARVLAHRARVRGIPAEIIFTPHNQPLPTTGDIYLLGGGEDRAQIASVEALRSSLGVLGGALDRGAQVTAPGVVPALLQVQEVRGEESVVERAVCKAERRRGIEQADVCGPTAGEQRAAEFATPLAKRVVRLASARKRRLYEHVRVR